MTRSSVLSKCVRNPSFLASPGFCFFLLLLLCCRPLLDLERCRDRERPSASASASLVSLLGPMAGGESRSGIRAEDLGAASLFIVAYHHPAQLRCLLCIEAGPEMARAWEKKQPSSLYRRQGLKICGAPGVSGRRLPDSYKVWPAASSV